MKPHPTFGVVREVKRSRSFKMAMDPMDREPNVYNRETNVYDTDRRGSNTLAYVIGGLVIASACWPSSAMMAATNRAPPAAPARRRKARLRPPVPAPRAALPRPLLPRLLRAPRLRRRLRLPRSSNFASRVNCHKGLTSVRPFFFSQLRSCASQPAETVAARS